MKMLSLGQTGITVSQICLGSMTWGSQNSQAEAHEQLDHAIGAGINFIDTAEMYPTTPRLPQTTGRTETIIGSWLKRRADRDRLVVATKVTGEGNADIRDGARVGGKILRQALEQSLKRLQTSHVDLFQLHWPNRGSYHFRKYWNHDPRNCGVGAMDDEIADILGEAGRLISEGKMRAFGLSNETAWGTMKFLQAHEPHALPRIASVQNEYSLLCRIYDTDMAEINVHENVPLLAFSPLAAGLLSGKYADGEIATGTRMSMQPTLNGRRTQQSEAAVLAYRALARKHGFGLAEMAIAFCLNRPFTIIPIIGATSLAQLRSNLRGSEILLDAGLLGEIEAVRREHAMPM